jgi:hypothetical protein
MRPMAWVAIALALVVVVAVVALVRDRRRRAEEMRAALDSMQVQVQAIIRIFQGELDFYREELHLAFDRVQQPEWAVQQSQSERAMKTGPVDPGISGPIQELGMSAEMRQRQMAIEEELAEKLAQRGVDPSELQSASAEYRGVDGPDGS